MVIKHLVLDSNLLINIANLDHIHYSRLKQLVTHNYIKVHIHEYVIEEYCNHALKEYSKFKKEYDEIKKRKDKIERLGLSFELNTSSIDVKGSMLNRVDDWISNHGFQKLSVSGDGEFRQTFANYFNLENAFEHNIIDEPRREAVKKNFIDSMIAQSCLASIGENIIFITNNLKDYCWLENEQKNIKIYKDLDMYFSTEGEAHILDINKKVNSQIYNSLHQIEVLDAIFKSIAEKLVNTEQVEVQADGFCCSIDAVYVSIYDDIEPSSIEIKEPLITQGSNKIKIEIIFKVDAAAYANYAVHVHDLMEEGIVSFKNFNYVILDDNIDIVDESDGEVLELSQSAIADLQGVLTLEVSRDLDLTDAAKLIETLKQHAVVQLNEEQCTARPHY